MEKSTLIELLKTFSKDDMLRLGELVDSPFHNKKSNVTRLFGIIKKYYPEFPPVKIHKEEIWKKLFPGKPYNYGIMKNLIHDTTGLAEVYLSLSGWKKNLRYDECLVEELYARPGNDLFMKKIKKYNDNLDRSIARDLTYYEKKCFILPYINTANNNTSVVDKERLRTNEVLMIYFLISYVTNSFHLVVEEQRANITHDHSFLRYMMEYFKGQPDILEESVELKIYFSLMLSYLDITDDENFIKSRRLFREHYEKITEYDRKNFYNILIALCSLKEFAGKHDYKKTLLMIYIEIIDKECLTYRKGQPVQPTSFRNIVSFSSELEEFAIMEDFILKNKDKVSARGDVIELYSNAMILFSKGKYAECSAVCSRISFSEIFDSISVAFFFKNDIKMLLEKCMYELDMTENLISSIDAHKHFLKNSESISVNNKLATVNFVNILSELLKLKLAGDKDGTGMLKRKIENTQRLNSRNWLVRKLSLLEK